MRVSIDAPYRDAIPYDGSVVTSSFGDDDPLDPFGAAADLPPLELAEPTATPPTGPRTFGDDHPLEAGLAPLDLAPATPRTPSVPPSSTPAGSPGRPPPEPRSDRTGPAPGAPEAIREAARRKAEASALAGFGDPPSNPIQALPYTIHVLLRLRDLWRGRRELEQRLGAACRRLEAAYAALGSALLRHQRADLDAHGLGNLAVQAERALGETDARRNLMQRTRAEADAEKRRLDEEIARAEAAVAPLRDREAKLRAELDVLSHELRRRKAALQRVQIELRNTPTQARELEASLEARRNDVAVQQTKVDAKAQDLREVQAQLATGLDRVRRQQATRKHLDRELTSSILNVEATAGQAASQADRLLHELAQRARAANVPMNVLEGATAVKADEHVATLQRELALHEEALRVWDRRGVAIGGTILAAFAIVMLVVFVGIVR